MSEIPVDPTIPPQPAPTPAPSDAPAPQAGDSETIEQLQAQLAEANAKISQIEQPTIAARSTSSSTSTPTTSGIGVASTVAQPPETPDDAQQEATLAIGPGSAGAPVAQLAAKLEAAGEKTYLSNPQAQNPGHVFTDELMQAVRRVLHSHPAILDVVDEAERQRLNRWISGLEVITAEVHKLIDDVAEQKQAPSA